jgi:hypothetical protein
MIMYVHILTQLHCSAIPFSICGSLQANAFFCVASDSNMEYSTNARVVSSYQVYPYMSFMREFRSRGV